MTQARHTVLIFQKSIWHFLHLCWCQLLGISRNVCVATYFNTFLLSFIWRVVFIRFADRGLVVGGQQYTGKLIFPVFNWDLSTFCYSQACLNRFTGSSSSPLPSSPSSTSRCRRSSPGLTRRQSQEGSAPSRLSALPTK